MSFKITFTFELDVKLNYTECIQIKNIYKVTIELKIIFIELL